MKSAEGVYKPNPGPDGANLFIYHLPQVKAKEQYFPFSISSISRSSQTRTSAKHSSHSAPLSQPRCSSTSRPTCPSALVRQLIPTTNTFKPNPSNRICLLHNKRGGTRGNPGNERLSGWHQEAQGPTQETQRLQQTLLIIKYWVTFFSTKDAKNLPPSFFVR